VTVTLAFLIGAAVATIASVGIDWRRRRATALRRPPDPSTLRLGRMLAALSAINEAIMRVESPDELFGCVCDAAVLGGEFTTAAVWVPKDGFTTAAAARGKGAEMLVKGRMSLHPELAEGRHTIGDAFRTAQPVISNDIQHDARFAHWRELAKSWGFASAAAIPLVRDGKSVGILQLYSSSAHTFDAEIAGLLNRMAANVVFALESMERRAEQSRDREIIRASRARFDRVTRGSNDGLWELHIDGYHLWVSDRYTAMLGYKP
jgi:GAF domain-containing protein